MQKELSKVDGNSFSETLLNAGVPAGPVRNMEETINHPQTKVRDMILHKNDYYGIATPIKFSRSKSVGIKNVPPGIGANTSEILKEIQLTEDEIKKLYKNKIVYSANLKK